MSTFLAAAAPLVLAATPYVGTQNAREAPSLGSLLQRAESDLSFREKGLEDAIVALGAGCLPELRAQLERQAEGSLGPPLARGLARLGRDDALATLKQLAGSPRAAARASAAAGLAATRSKRGLTELLPLLRDAEPNVELAVCHALVAMERSAPGLSVRVEVERVFGRGTDLISRVHAARCLAELASPESLSALERGLSAWEPDVRAASAAALARIGMATDDGRARLVELASDRDLETRKHALLATGTLKIREAVPAMLEALEDEHPGLRDSAHRALRTLSGHRFPASPERWRDWWSRESRTEKHPP